MSRPDRRTIRLLAVLSLIGGLIAASGAPGAVSAAPPVQSPPRLRVVARQLAPFVMRQNGRLAGFSVELWEAIAQDLGITYEWIEVGSVTRQLEAVQRGKADAAIAAISMTAERERVVDFSHPYFAGGLQILTRDESGQLLAAVLASLISPTVVKILGIGLLILLAMAHVIWLFERWTNPDFPRDYRRGIGEGLWWAIGVVAQQGYGDRPADSALRRLVTAFWIFIGIILITQFTASVTANVTVQQLTGSINGLSDLPGKQIATVRGTTAAHYLASENMGFVEVSRIEEAYQLLEQGQVQAVVYDAPILLYYAMTQGKGKVRVVGGIFQHESYGIALPTGSPYRELINQSLLELEHNGVYQTLYARWFGDSE